MTSNLIYLEVCCPRCENIWVCPIDPTSYDNLDGEDRVYPTEIKCPSCVQVENREVQLELLFA